MCIANLSALPVKIYAGEGIGQVLFFESDEEPSVSYADRKGKYQEQKTITGARL
jgi:dCTP deaminase